MRSARVCALLCCLCAGAVAAAPPGKGYSVGPAPGWVDEQVARDDFEVPEKSARGGSFYLLSDDQVRGGPTGQTYRRRVKKLLSVAAVQESSRISIEVDPVYERLLVHRVEIRREGKRIDALRAAEVRVVQNEPELDDDVLSGRQTVLFILRDVRAGDVLDWSFTVTGTNPVLGGRFSDSFSLARAIPVARLRCRVVWPDGRPLHYASQGISLEPRISRRGGATEFVWERENVPAFEMEDRVPTWFEVVPQVQVTDFGSWGEVVRWASDLYDVEPGDSASLEALAARFRPLPTPEARVLAAVRFVQDEVRYLGMEEGTGSHRPRAPDVVLARRFGDCKDKALLTVALLGRLGVEAHVALVNSAKRGLIERRLPSPYDFDHVIVRILLDGRACWVDATASHQGGSLASMTLSHFDRALLVREGSNGLVPVPFQTPDEPTRIVKERLVAPSGDKPGTLTVQTILTGSEADAARAMLAFGSLEELAQTSRQRYEDDEPGVEIVRSPVVKDARGLNRLEILEEYRLPTFWTDGVRPVRGWAVARYLSTPQSSRRTQALSISHPVFVSQTVEVELPEDAHVEHDDVDVEDASFRFSHSSSESGRTVTVHYTYRSLGDSIEPGRVTDYLVALKKADRVLVCNVAEPGETSESGFAALSLPKSRHARAVAVAVGAVFAAVVGFFAFRSLRLARRRRSFRRRFQQRLGESPATAIEVAHDSDLHTRLGDCRCPCGRPVADHPSSEETAVFDGRKLRIVTPDCPGRSDVPSYYFKLPIDAARF